MSQKAGLAHVSTCKIVSDEPVDIAATAAESNTLVLLVHNYQVDLGACSVQKALQAVSQLEVSNAWAASLFVQIPSQVLQYAVTREKQTRNVSIYLLSEPGFRHHLQRCSRVVCNTGFALIAEALHLGTPILTRPLSGQFEQIANAMALKQLKLATVTHHLGILSLEKFLNDEHSHERIIYPNVTRELVAFCLRQITDEQILEKDTLQVQAESSDLLNTDDSLSAMAARLWSAVRRESADESSHERPAPALNLLYGRQAAQSTCYPGVIGE
jgi:hypothetical protein